MPAKRGESQVAPAALPVLAFKNQKAWAAWLARHGETSPGLWLRLASKRSSVASVTYAEAVETALSHGWIDGQKKSEDDQYWLQRFTPRGKRSIWSQINRDKALALIAAGTMQPAGLAEVERAKADGRWDAAYQPQSKATVPDDLAEALKANPRAASFFKTLDRANRYAVLFRINAAKRPETRTRRIAQFVEMLAKEEKLHP